MFKIAGYNFLKIIIEESEGNAHQLQMIMHPCLFYSMFRLQTTDSYKQLQKT